MGLIFTLGWAVPSNAERLLMYADPDYKSFMISRDTQGKWNMSPAHDDRLSSYDNETAWAVAWYYDRNWTGGCWTGNPRERDPAFWWWDDDKVSSYRLGRGC